MIFSSLGIIASLFPATSSAGPGMDGAGPAFPLTVSFTCTGITNRAGNITGVTIPLKRAGRLFLFEGTINGMAGNFILDTGASGLVLNTTYFRNAIAVADVEGGGVTGSAVEVARLHVQQLTVSEWVFENFSADVIPLGHIENRRGVKILGLFGMGLLKNVEMVVDLRRSELQLHKLDKNGNRIAPPPAVVKYDILEKINEFHNILFVKATIGGKVLDFCLDTGAESNVLSIDANKKVLAAVTITRRSGLTGSGADRGEVLFGSLNEFKMGNRQMVPMETIVCSMVSMSRKYGCPVDGMLGYDFFAKGKFYINLVKKEMGVCLLKEENK